MISHINLVHGIVQLPAFFPDGTYGAVRCVDARDLDHCGVDGLVMNGFHLLTKPGLGVLKSFGGLHAFTAWHKPILTDSGGFQIFSLIRENPKNGEIRKNEVIFRPNGGKEKVILTPEKSIAAQFAYGSDIMMCFDYCTHPDDSYETNALSVDMTIEWAKRCKQEYQRQMSMRKIPDESRPLLFGIIQGGSYVGLRDRCASALIDIGFDGYGFGGFPVNGKGELTEDMLAYTARLMPDTAVKYAMGIGKPEGIIKCFGKGYGLFDCVIPTREARHNRLYVFIDDASGESLAYTHHYILDEKHIRRNEPVSSTCDCLTCKSYTAAYLHHLAKVGDSLVCRLATIHNLRFYMRLMERLRNDVNHGS